MVKQRRVFVGLEQGFYITLRCCVIEQRNTVLHRRAKREMPDVERLSRCDRFEAVDDFFYGDLLLNRTVALADHRSQKEALRDARCVAVDRKALHRLFKAVDSREGHAERDCVNLRAYRHVRRLVAVLRIFEWDFTHLHVDCTCVEFAEIQIISA